MNKTNEIRKEYLSSSSIVYTGDFNGEVYGVSDRFMTYGMYLKVGETLGFEVVMNSGEPYKNYIYLDSDNEVSTDEFDWIFNNYAKVIPDKYVLEDKTPKNYRVKYTAVVDKSININFIDDDIIYMIPNSGYFKAMCKEISEVGGHISVIIVGGKKDGNIGSIIFDVKEGDIENHLVVEPNGDMYLDGRKLEISDVSSENFNGITPKRASSWSSRPPAGVKSWSYHRTVSRKKVYLNTKAGQVTAAVIGIILTGAGWVGYVYNAACFAHLTGGYSSCLSFKSVRYVGNPRYLRAYRLDQTLYTEANFKGKSTFYRTYGYNIPNV